MRTFPPTFTYANSAAEKSPRFVVAIKFETDSIYLTSHPDVPNVPGIVVENVLRHPSAVSQRIIPDEGRSEIGSMSFDALDLDSALTDAFRAKLTGGANLRGKIVELYLGYSAADFSQYQLFQTQVVQRVAFERGVYQFSCADITREQRKDIFDPKRTTLTASIDADDTTIEVASTLGFEMVDHGTTWSDAPNTTAGYVRIQDEIIRYEDLSASQFLDCTRGVLNTRAVPHTVDLNQNQDQRTKVEEFIYLELPAPQLALAVLTGESPTLPAHWSLGIDAEQWIKETDFTLIGNDLWNQTTPSQSFVPRFAGLKKTDGKRFLEREVFQLIGCYPIVYADGRLGLKRMNPVLADASAAFEINEHNSVSWSSLTFDMDGMSNVFRVDWNHTDVGGKEGFTRAVNFIDATSISLHGRAPPKLLQFKGLFGSRHTDATVKARIDALRDRYSHPPALMTVELMPSLNRVEVGDIGRVKLPLVRDYAGTEASINRSFEIQRASLNYATGQVSVELFGSTGRAGEISTSGPGGEGPDEDNSLPDAWYESAGTELSTVVDITVVGDVGVIDAGTWNLTGHANLTNGAAIYYYEGDLELPDGATLNISDNVQLRVRGFATINGDINGVGAGLAGQADTAGYGTSAFGLPGYFNSRGMDGLRFQSVKGVLYNSLPPALTVGLQSTVPYFALTVDGGELLGLPTDLRGTSGGAGGKIERVNSPAVIRAGGTGGHGGAGLCLIARGATLGLSATINLSGGDSATPAVASIFHDIYPGAGGAGAPGALLILLDGSNLSLPDLSNRFVATTGTVGAPLQHTHPSATGWALANKFLGSGPLEGYANPAMISGVDLSNSAYRIQYIPGQQTPGEDAPAGVPAPTALSATGIAGGIVVQATLPTFDLFDSVQYYASATNDRADSTKVQEVKASSFTHSLASSTTRYYWARCSKGSLVSDWYPESATAGVSATSS